MTVTRSPKQKVRGAAFDATLSHPHIYAMLTPIELQTLGRKAAQGAAGEDAVRGVEVMTGEDDLDRPVYVFSFLIDQARARQRPGLVRIRLIQSLSDELASRGDGRYPVVRILDDASWDRRSVA